MQFNVFRKLKSKLNISLDKLFKKTQLLSCGTCVLFTRRLEFPLSDKVICIEVID